MNINSRLTGALRVAGYPVVGVWIPNPLNQTTWRVDPSGLTPQQVTDGNAFIQAFNPNNPADDSAELNTEVIGRLDNERIYSAIVWTIIDTYSAPATITKFNTARTKLIAAFKAQPWKP